MTYFVIGILWIASICVGAAITCLFFKRTIDELEAEIVSLTADLKAQKAARKEQTRKYDELYDQFFRLTQTNSEMAREVQLYKNTYEEAADEVYPCSFRELLVRSFVSCILMLPIVLSAVGSVGRGRRLLSQLILLLQSREPLFSSLCLFFNEERGCFV